jgi:membrane associated rhomboid family serine protease
MSLITDLKDKYKALSVLQKIIAINIAIFVVSLLLKRLFPMAYTWLELPSTPDAFIFKPWTLVSYAFLHYDPLHMLFNMLWLYFVGELFLNLFKPKTALNVYFLGAIVGGVFFVLGYTLMPSFFKGTAYLVGASAAVRALFIFLCAYMPNKEVQIFSFNIKLWHIGVFLIVIDVFGLFGDNSGGNMAHLGGAFLGYMYAKQLLKGNDIGRGFEGLIDTISSWFKTSKKVSPLKTVYKDKSKVGGYTKGEFNEFNNQKKIDVILDKISKSGYESLTEAEKDFLFKAGK